MKPFNDSIGLIEIQDSKKKGSVETHMNGCSHPNHENACFKSL